MKLYASDASPFVRKVRLVADLLDLPLDLIDTPVHDGPPDLLAANPLGKIPTLELDDGSTLFDSPLIVQALDDMAGHRLLAPMGPERWEALRDTALADGITEAAVSMVYNQRLPPTEQSPSRRDHLTRAIGRALAAAAKAPPAWPRLPALALAVALEYLDFRLPEIDWRRDHPALADWHAALADEPLLTTTRPR